MITPTPWALVIDVPVPLRDAAVRFWAAALGAEPRWPTTDDDPYVPLAGAASRLEVLIQAVDDDARYHLDLPAADVDAEADRLVGLGGRRLVFDDDHWVLADPAGLRFCVIPAQVHVAPIGEPPPGRGRLDGVFVDVEEALVERELAFWSAALGAAAEPTSRPGTYTSLQGVHGPGGPLLFEVQRLGAGRPRHHVDLTAADVPGEAARLEALGATRVAEVESWIVLTDPAGLLLCVVPDDEDAP